MADRTTDPRTELTHLRTDLSGEMTRRLDNFRRDYRASLDLLWLMLNVTILMLAALGALVAVLAIRH